MLYLGIAIGLVVGAFLPSLGRKIKSAFVKYGEVAEQDIRKKF